ncbi:MAG: LysR family transcriptional regulator [Hyphomicrobiaceae bacterium]
METHEIRYFLAVARELNFTRAAEACGVSQPALTRAMQKLEAELGGALFLRRPGQIELTRLGREVLPQLEAINRTMGDVHRLAETVSRAGRNALRLGVMCTVGPTSLVGVLEQVRQALPDLELSITDARSRDIVALIAQDEIDVGIAAWPQYPESVRADPLHSERFAVAMRAGDQLAGNPAIELERLAGQSYIDRLGCEFDDHFAALHGEWTIDLDIVFASEREDWIQGLLLAGLGYAIVPEFMHLADGLVKRPLSMPEVSREVAILTLRGKPLSPAAATFVRLAKSHRWPGR